MTKINGVEMIEADPDGGFAVGMSNSPTLQDAMNDFLRSRGIDPRDGCFRNQIRGQARAKMARKAKRNLKTEENAERPTSNVQRRTKTAACECCGLVVDRKENFCHGCKHVVCLPCCKKHGHFIGESHHIPRRED